MKIISLLFLISFVSIHSQAQDDPNPVKVTLYDGARLIKSPFQMTKKEAIVTLAAVTLVGGSSLLDQTNHERLRPFSNSSSAEDFRRFGNIGQVSCPIIGTVFAIHGWAEKNERSKETALLSYETFFLSGAAESVIKFASGRERPSRSDNPFYFKPGRWDSSFPSGHTTVAFAAATVVSEQYPHWYVSIPAYTFAGAVGYSRLYASKHWTSDVVAGAMLGTVISHYLIIWHRKTKQDTDQTLEINPAGLRWVKKF